MRKVGDQMPMPLASWSKCSVKLKFKMPLITSPNRISTMPRRMIGQCSAPIPCPRARVRGKRKGNCHAGDEHEQREDQS